MTNRFWVTHLVVPCCALVVLLSLIWLNGWDEALARRWFYDTRLHQWLGKGAGDWWARDILHTGGRNMVRGVAASALLLWLLSFWVSRLQPYRAQAGYVALSMVLATTLVGALKAVTNVDCPWDLSGFGGVRPYVGLFEDRPDWLPRAKCFPGAHSASGFALMSFYFAWFKTPGRAKFIGLAGGLTTGLLFAFGQEARGAHFLSHDLVGALLVWLVLLVLFARSRALAAPL